jgi:outer membrane murein-binding lipoprotein Lpp
MEPTKSHIAYQALALAALLTAGCSARDATDVRDAKVDALEARVASLEAKAQAFERARSSVPWILWKMSGMRPAAESGYSTREDCHKAAEALVPTGANLYSRDPLAADARAASLA